MSDSPVVLVTGATGFLAGHVVKQLLEKGYRVRGTVRSLSNDTKLRHLHEMQKQHPSKLELVQADLMDGGSWLPAVDGCTFVAHVASPAPAKNPKTEDELVKPAVEGTVNVLNACKRATSVRRVVVTGSRSAIAEGFDGPHAGPKADPSYVFTESDWSDVDHAIGWRPYIKSKVCAEKAAWEAAEGAAFDLVVINPSFIIGPVLGSDVGTSAGLIQRLLTRWLPCCLDLSFNIVHVDNVAEAHVAALETPEAGGHRFLTCSDETWWMRDVAALLDRNYGPRDYSVPTKQMPNWAAWCLSWFEPTIRMVYPTLSRERRASHAKSVKILKIKYKTSERAILDCADSLVESGLAKPKRGTSPVVVFAVVAVLAAAGAAAWTGKLRFW